MSFCGAGRYQSFDMMKQSHFTSNSIVKLAYYAKDACNFCKNALEKSSGGSHFLYLFVRHNKQKGI